MVERRCDDELLHDEDEALSLSDLPINLLHDDDDDTQVGHSSKIEDQDRAEAYKAEDDQEFAFGSWLGGSPSTESQMCAADELFFQGQILPRRLSVSSDIAGGFSRAGLIAPSCPKRFVLRTDSMDTGSISTLLSTMGSSRSNSNASSNSSSSSSTTNTTSAGTFGRVNPFHAHPSPKPQIGSSLTHHHATFRSRSQKTTTSLSSSSSVWDFFRLGLVRAPELDLRESRARSSNATVVKGSVSRNSSSSSSSNGHGVADNGGQIRNAHHAKNVAEKQGKSQRPSSSSPASFLGGCRCSVDDAVSSKVLALKNSVGRRSISCSSSSSQVRTSDVEEIRLLMMISKTSTTTKKKKTATMIKQKEEGKQKQSNNYSKQALSRHRTSEWLKELSHAAYYPEQP